MTKKPRARRHPADEEAPKRSSPPPRPPGQEFSDRLQALRKERHLTQEELAARAHRHRTSIVRLEAGEVVPDYGTLLELAEALDCPPGEFFYDEAYYDMRRVVEEAVASNAIHPQSGVEAEKLMHLATIVRRRVSINHRSLRALLDALRAGPPGACTPEEAFDLWRLRVTRLLRSRPTLVRALDGYVNFSLTGGSQGRAVAMVLDARRYQPEILYPIGWSNDVRLDAKLTVHAEFSAFADVVSGAADLDETIRAGRITFEPLDVRAVSALREVFLGTQATPDDAE